MDLKESFHKDPSFPDMINDRGTERLSNTESAQSTRLSPFEQSQLVSRNKSSGMQLYLTAHCKPKASGDNWRLQLET